MSKHVHQYKRIRQKPSERIIYRCMRPNCNHYLTPEFILGKASVCWQCRNDFVMDQYSVERTFPKCLNCRTRITNLSKPRLTESLVIAPKGPRPISLPESDTQSKVENASQPDLLNPVADILKRYGLSE